eukprot:10269363-Lingulodinium_polyedra.AAC.1
MMILAMGLELGLYRDKDSLPLFRETPFGARKEAPGEEKEEAELEEARKATAAASSSSAGGGEAWKGPVQKEDTEVKHLRAKAKNTLFLVGELLATEGLQDLARMLFTLAKPIYTQHSAEAAELRSPQATRDWHHDQAKGSWVLDLWEVARTLEDVSEKLPYMGFCSPEDTHILGKLPLTHSL